MMLFEAAPLPATRDALKSDWHVESVVFSPCENAQNGADYLARMNRNVDDLQQALSRGK
jgi:hypothetical protein